MALIEITPLKHSGRSRKGGYYVGISATKQSKTGAQQTTFSLTTAAMADLRWVIGDRVKILLDADTNEVHLRRATPGSGGSFALSPSNVVIKNALERVLN